MIPQIYIDIPVEQNQYLINYSLYIENLFLIRIGHKISIYIVI